METASTLTSRFYKIFINFHNDCDGDDDDVDGGGGDDDDDDDDDDDEVHLITTWLGWHFRIGCYFSIDFNALPKVIVAVEERVLFCISESVSVFSGILKLLISVEIPFR